MALKMSFTKAGFTYPDSYWKLASYSFDYITGTGRFVLNGYPNADCRKESLLNVIETHGYNINRPMNVPDCYAYALPKEGATEWCENPSFFDGAEIV